MSEDTVLVASRSRRSLLAGAAGGVAALAARALGQIPPAQAADGDPILLGQDNTASTKTSVTANVPGTTAAAFEISNTGLGGRGLVASAAGYGVQATGITGISGGSNSINGSGVLGEDLTGASLGRGVEGIAQNGWGVYAVTANGQALRVDGRATFSRTGKVTISFPNKTATVSVPGPLSSPHPFRNGLALLWRPCRRIWLGSL